MFLKMDSYVKHDSKTFLSMMFLGMMSTEMCWVRFDIFVQILGGGYQSWACPMYPLAEYKDC